MNTQDILALVGFAIVVIALPLSAAVLIDYVATRAKNLK